MSAATKDFPIPADFSDMGRRRLSGVPKHYRTLYLRVVNDKATRQMAIKSMCLECMGYDKKEIRDCTSTSCPLHHYRPFRGSKVPPKQG